MSDAGTTDRAFVLLFPNAACLTRFWSPLDSAALIVLSTVQCALSR